MLRDRVKRSAITAETAPTCVPSISTNQSRAPSFCVAGMPAVAARQLWLALQQMHGDDAVALCRREPILQCITPRACIVGRRPQPHHAERGAASGAAC